MSSAPIRTAPLSRASSSMPWSTSHGGRIRRMPRAITTGTMTSTWPGRPSHGIPGAWASISIATCSGYPIAPPTWSSNRDCANDCGPPTASAPASTMGTNGRIGGTGAATTATTAGPAPTDTAAVRSYSPSEMMAAVAARELRDGEVVFVGIGLPNLACNLARATHAPNLVLIYESGAVGAVPDRLPVSIGGPALVTGSLAVATMADVFQFYLQGGRIQVGFLGGAQIDRYGNINSTVIGPYEKPKV